MLILSLDTSSPAGSIAVLEDFRLRGAVSTMTDETYSSRIFRQLEFLLNELQLKLNHFDLFAVNAGPGSFTGLRVGLTTSKAWAESFGKPVVAVSGLEAVAAQAISAADTVIPVIDARRGQFYAGLYRRSSDASANERQLARSADDAVMTPEEFVAWTSEVSITATRVLATPCASFLESALSRCGSTLQGEICEVSAFLAPTIGKLAFLKAKRGQTVDSLRLDANYVRRSDAELNWKGK
ncbi:MAG TPA: tRNA (adenosine(37)-N6)-threonylcarbamoyltransferase complex dimerization subunit type 1 TsaB [Candidatus Aquilonibacter sp.]|nr:tRNA (adenosine(37)-N6)-threonylcarbamoyltransferase complex dimerization subunit type 1 TsaB [Candidatus Aquilonibacter sp.]